MMIFLKYHMIVTKTANNDKSTCNKIEIKMENASYEVEINIMALNH